MSKDSRFRLTPFQRGLYRHYINSQRKFDEKHRKNLSVSRITYDQAGLGKIVEQVVEFDRTLPLDTRGIASILRAHTLWNRGEKRTQALRLMAGLDDLGEKGVMAVTIDALYGLVEFRFSYKSWRGAERLARTMRLTELLRADAQPYVLALYRLCELLDPAHVSLIANALAYPDGIGFPKFTKGAGRQALALLRTTAPLARSGVPEHLTEGTWYAMECSAACTEPSDTLRIYIGQAYSLRRRLDDWHFRAGGISLVAENEGYGRMMPTYEVYRYEPWIPAGRRLFRMDAEQLEAIKAHVERPFNGTTKLMAECLKTV